jgi:hypothetical protein
LAFVRLYLDTGDTERVAALSWSAFWLVLPSLAMLLLLPVLLRIGWNFWLGLGVSCFAAAAFYWLMVWLLGRIGIPL